MTEPKKKKRRKTSAEFREDWLDRKWRPIMGWMYFAVCVTDFILFPIMWAVFQAHIGQSNTEWNPLTLQGGGLFHIAMGAVLGVAAWTRGQEKLARYDRGHYDSYEGYGGYDGYSGGGSHHHHDQYEETTEVNPMEPVVEEPPNQFYRFKGGQ